MNILLVGAGAVGQVYGHHLQQGGARVAFYVRPHAAHALAAGMTLYPLRRRGERTPVTFRADAVYTSLDDVARETWDQVWLAVPSTALDEGWLRSIAEAVKDALVVALPPGMDSEERIRKAFPGDRVVPALIGMISYQAPLPGEEVPIPGVAYLFPPGNPTSFGGSRGREAADALRRGGAPVRVKHDTGKGSAFGSSLLMPNIAALEASGWSLAELGRGRWLPVAAGAARQAIQIAAARMGTGAPPLLFLLRGLTLRLVWAVIPWVLPIDLEAYLRYHFTKVGAQTRQLLAELRREGEARGLPTDAIAELAAKLADLDGAPAP